MSGFMHIQDRFRTAIELNNARIGKLRILFDEEKEKLKVFYLKNKKQKPKEYSQAID